MSNNLIVHDPRSILNLKRNKINERIQLKYDLNATQFKILRLAITGVSKSIIGYILKLSDKTVENNLAVLKQKFKARNMIHLCLICIKLDIITLDEMLEIIGPRNDD